MNLVMKAFSISDFQDYVNNIQLSNWRPNFVVIHNTSVPNQALYKSWHSKPNWTIENWLRNLASYYAGMGWSGCPHLFVAYDKICVLNDLRFRGTHSPSWNSISWGVETVGEFQTEPFDGGVKENLIAALGILHSKLGLNPADFKLGTSGLHFHKEDKKTTHTTCPGKNLVKSDLIHSVVDYMNKDNGEHLHIPEVVHTADTNVLSNGELTSIKWVQLKLGVTADGILGAKTKKAIKDFQASHNLVVDGIAGPITRKALLDYIRV